MSKGPERRYIDSVHRKLPPANKLPRQGMTGTFGNNGTPDYYYDGPKSDLWLEWKFGLLLKNGAFGGCVKFKMTTLQWIWCTRRYTNGLNCFIAIGVNGGGGMVIEPHYVACIDADSTDSQKTFVADPRKFGTWYKTTAEVAAWISDFCGV